MLQEEHKSFSTDQFHRQLLYRKSLGEYWTSFWKERAVIGNEAMTFLLPFATTYLCEQGFSALTVIPRLATVSILVTKCALHSLN